MVYVCSESKSFVGIWLRIFPPSQGLVFSLFWWWLCKAVFNLQSLDGFFPPSMSLEFRFLICKISRLKYLLGARPDQESFLLPWAMKLGFRWLEGEAFCLVWGWGESAAGTRRPLAPPSRTGTSSFVLGSRRKLVPKECTHSGLVCPWLPGRTILGRNFLVIILGI